MRIQITSKAAPKEESKRAFARRYRRLLSVFCHAALSIVLVLTMIGSAGADGDSCPTDGVEVSFQGTVCGIGNFFVSLNGEVATGNNIKCLGGELTFTSTNKAFVKLKPDQTYLVTSGNGICINHINFDVPPDYTLFIDGVETKTIMKTNNGQSFSGDGSWNLVLRKKCAKRRAPGESGSDVRSVVWEAGLGDLVDGRSAENISIREKILSSAIYGPGALVYTPPAQTSEVEVIRNNSVLRQVKAPQTLADVVTISSSEYEIRYYRPADVGPKSGGIYTFTAPAYVTWNIKNPDPSTTTRLLISKIEGGITTDQVEYLWDPSIDTWTHNSGWDRIAQVYSRIKTKTVSYPTESSRTETFVVKENNNPQIVSRIARTYLTFPWGEELIQEVVDPGGASLTTSYTYYDNIVEDHRYGKIKTIVFPDGSWEKYDYDFDWNVASIMRPWKDLSLETATPANSRMTLYGYINSDNGVFGVSGFLRFPYDIEEQIGGVTVRKTRINRSMPSLDPEPLVSEAEASYSDSDNGAAVNLITQTITTRFYHTATQFLANRISSVVYPDGRKDSYTYEKGNYVPNADPSLSQFTPDANGVAERETVVHGTTSSPNGVAFKTTKEVIVRDQQSNDVLQETYVYDGTGYERIAWTVNDYDGRGHRLMSRDHRGQVTTATWSGEQKTSEIDATGVETTYSYDSLNRLKTQTRKGIAAGGGFPAQNDVVTTFSYDAEDQQIGEVVTGGSLSLSSSRAYDKARRLIRETDQAGLTTTYSYSNGGRKQTITRAGGATEIIDKYLDGEMKSITGSSEVARYFDNGVNADGTRWTQVFVGASGLTSPRWTKTTVDWIDRTVSVEKPSFTGTNVIQTFFYNPLTLLQKQTTFAGPTKLVADVLYEYDELGRPTRTGVDINGDGALTLLSTDRLNETDEILEKLATDWFRVNTTRNFLTDNNDTPTNRVQRERLNNFPLNGAEQTITDVTVTDVAGNNTRTTTAIARAAKKQIVTYDTPNSNLNAITITVNGLLQSSTRTTPQTATTYLYDALGRPISTTDPRTGTTSRSYSTTTGQLTATNDGAGTSTYEYYQAAHDNAGRLKAQTDPIEKKSYFSYNSRGQVTRTWGDTTYPLEYVYDSYGQNTELHTFRGGQNWTASVWPSSTTGTADATKWIYQESTGVLTQKQDAALKGATYTYDELGRVKTRVWARGITCTYGYDAVTGELRTITYSDSTPAVAFTYDRGGRQTTVTDAAGSRTRTFNVANEMQTEQIAGGILDGVSINVGHDSLLRRNSLQTLHGTNTLSSQTYGYDPTSRLQTITSGSQTVTYGYHADSGLMNSTAFTGGTNVSRTYDNIGRLQNITTTPAADTAQSYTYTINDLNQRTRVTREDGSYWSYVYNDRGELVTGKKYWSDNSVVWGAQTAYNFDNIGNRKEAKNGGNQLGTLRLSNYTTNALNQYQQRTVAGAVDVTGTANAAATVSVNNQATARKADYYYKELAVDNSTAPVNAQVNVVGARNNSGPGGQDAIAQKGGRAFLPQAAEAFTYDDDGNLTADGRWTYTWNADNRLVAMEALAALPAELKQRLEFSYDFAGTRIQKKVYVWNTQTSTYDLQSLRKFVNDGWNVVAELDGSNNLVRSFVWGQDLSGALQAAGGVGGLLLINDGGQTYQAGYDGSGNLTTLVKAGAGTIAASYEYDPFGVTVKALGEYVANNPFRFSTKYEDTETGLLYYGYRYYQPQTGRWLSRDPLEENGGVNVYGFIGNDPINQMDPLGLYDEDVHYYLTYYLARQTGCFTQADAQAIAEGNQTTDELEALKPGPGITEARASANERYHALTPPENHWYNLRNLAREAMRGLNKDSCGGGRNQRKEQLTNFGRYLHYFQDIFAHEGFEGRRIGHGRRGHLQDQPWRPENINRARQMARETYEQMRQYAQKLKCCKGSPANGGNVQWDKVDQFLSIEYGTFLEGMDPQTLEAKRRTLTDYSGRYPVPRRVGGPQ
jgi:RHS repeat-associated protein